MIKKKKMSKERRWLIHNVMDGNIELVHQMHQLTRYRDCDKILTWLIENKIKGKSLLGWIKIKFNGSLHGMVLFIVNYYNKNKEFTSMFYGKDWK
jgi:hypothetical protein